jgi:hypothetical protein
VVDLQPGESVLHSSAVVWVGGPGPRPGTLTLTNRAILFEGPVPAGPPGGAGAGPPAMEEGLRRIPLWRCRDAKVAAGPAGPRLELDLLQRSIFFRTPEAAAWAAAINQAKASAPPPPPGAGGGGMAAGPGAGIAARRAAMPKCSYCDSINGPMATRCKSCGAPLAA